MPKWQEEAVYQPDHGFPVIADVDVAVIGGGAAGVAAARTTGRTGLTTLLVERYGFCGGNAVAGLSGTICGMYYASDRTSNRPEQAVFGFAEEFRDTMLARGGLTEPQRYGKTWTHTHDPHIWREVADGLVEDAGVRVLYHTLVIGVIMEGKDFLGVVVAGKSGIGAIMARQIVDASGDGDVIHRAGFAYTMGDDGEVQNPTMIFRLGGCDVEKFLSFWGVDTISAPEVSQMLMDAAASGKYRLPRSKIWIFGTPRPDELLVNATRVQGRDGRELYAGSTEDLSEAEFAGRQQVREYARFLKDKIPGCELSFVNDTGVQAGIRQSRSIVGIDKLENEAVVGKVKRADGIVRSPWPIELHAGEKPKLEWLLDDYYEVSFGALVPIEGNNIIVAGRCLSAAHEALASARVTAQCFGYGHAAGLASIEALRSGRQVREIPGEEVRAMLNADGARLDG